MNFNIDKQTLDELNLMGKFRHGSVYHLFSKVKTRGGERLLDEMFRTPLTDAGQINQRSRVFRSFQEVALQFPFDEQQLALMLEYVENNTSAQAGVVLLKTAFKKLLSGLTRDERYRKSVQGLQATIVTLNRCHAFLASVDQSLGAFDQRMDAVSKILNDKHLEKLRNLDIYGALPVSTLAFYEHLLQNRMRDQIADLLQFIYELDLNIAVSKVAAAKQFTYAVAAPREANILSASELRHPCIDNAVGNRIDIDKNRNVIFLTGANMAGKSTLMKSIGIGLYLAHLGFPVAAGAMKFSVRDGLYSSINVADNIGLGYSHFYAEVVRVKQAAEAAASGKKLLLMFDELFKGTNVKDAFDGTLAVTEAFAEYRDCLFIVSTHIIEVGEALQGNDNIQFLYMPTIMDANRPRYTYLLREGITEDRQGMMIIRNEGILDLIC